MFLNLFNDQQFNQSPNIMTLTEAITAVENSATSLTTADSAQTVATDKFNAAKTAKDSADLQDKDAIISFNTALDALIAVANAAKVVRP